MAVAGPRLAGGLVDDTGLGTATWVITGTVCAVTLTAGASSHYLFATSFGFSLPSDSSVQGIRVAIGHLANVATLRDSAVRLLKAGVVTGSSEALGAAWPELLASTDYGGASDLWDSTWAPSDVNGGGFGVGFAAVNTDALVPGIATAQDISIRVDYALSQTGPTESALKKSYGHMLGIGRF